VSEHVAEYPSLRVYVADVSAEWPALTSAPTLTEEFVQILKHHDAPALDPRLMAAETSDLRPFAAELRRDHDAALAGVLFS